jgi:hypothetical protein
MNERSELCFFLKILHYDKKSGYSENVGYSEKIQKLKLLIYFVGEYSSLLNTEAFLNE